MITSHISNLKVAKSTRNNVIQYILCSKQPADCFVKIVRCNESYFVVCFSLKNRLLSILIIFNIPGYFSKEAEQANYLSTIDSQVILLFSLSSRLCSDNYSSQNVKSRRREAPVISRPQILTSSAGTCWWSSVSSCTAQSAGSDKQTERHQNHRRSCRTDKDTVCQRSILGENETSNLEKKDSHCQWKSRCFAEPLCGKPSGVNEFYFLRLSLLASNKSILKQDNLDTACAPNHQSTKLISYPLHWTQINLQSCENVT